MTTSCFALSLWKSTNEKVAYGVSLRVLILIINDNAALTDPRSLVTWTTTWSRHSSCTASVLACTHYACVCIGGVCLANPWGRLMRRGGLSYGVSCSFPSVEISQRWPATLQREREGDSILTHMSKDSCKGRALEYGNRRGETRGQEWLAVPAEARPKVIYN